MAPNLSTSPNTVIEQAVALIDQQIELLTGKLTEIKAERDKILAQTQLGCPNCNAYFAVRETVFVQDHWYTPPRGCTEGDYWNECKEGQCECPKCGSLLRLGAENTKLKRLFASVKQTHDGK